MNLILRNSPKYKMFLLHVYTLPTVIESREDFWFNHFENILIVVGGT